MNESATRIALILVGMLTTCGVLAAAVLYLGNRLGNLVDRQDFAARIRRLHVPAFAALLAGRVPAWMAFASQRPSRDKHLLLPEIFVVIVRAFPLVIEFKAASVSMGVHVLQRLFSADERSAVPSALRAHGRKLTARGSLPASLVGRGSIATLAVPVSDGFPKANNRRSPCQVF